MKKIYILTSDSRDSRRRRTKMLYARARDASMEEFDGINQKEFDAEQSFRVACKRLPNLS